MEATAETTFMHRLRELRLGRALTQEELGKLTGLARHTVSRLEGGTRTARPPTVRKLARALRVPVETLTRCAPPLRASQPRLPGLNGGPGAGGASGLSGASRGQEG